MHIEVRGKSLIIRWRFEGRKYHKTLKNHNNKFGWQSAETLMGAIADDIAKERFNPAAYTQAGKVKKQNIDITASELFAKYAEQRVENHQLGNSSKVRFKSQEKSWR